MARAWRVVTTSVVLATWWGMGECSAEAQVAPVSLTVAAYDYASLPPVVLDRAKDVATKIYGRINVSLKWLGPDESAEETPMNPPGRPALSAPLIRVRLLRRLLANGYRIAAGELGFAYSGGTLASVFVQRVEQLASNERQDVAELLGHVMAHEIGHLFLPPDSHSAGGIMAPSMDLFAIEHGGLWFDQREASIIRARIASMSNVR